MTGRALLVLAMLVGCGKEEPADRLMETGWFVDTGQFDADRCKARLGGIVPVDGTEDWYYRDPPSLWVEQADPEAYQVSLTDAQGVPAPVQPTWTADGLKLSFDLDAPLEPDTDYVFTVRDCATVTRSGFRTSSLGQPLGLDPEALIGRTYHLDLLGAEWIQPGGAESLIQLYFGAPALLGVRHADGLRIDLIGAPGEVDPFGGLSQAFGSTWDFPTAPFDTQPYFESDADLVVFQFEGVEIPIHGARLAATFSADGTVIGGGELSGLGDTRGLGAFLPGGSSDPGAICLLAASLGIDCEPCPDGEPYCMSLEARQIEGSLVEGLTLVPRN